ncbi:MAG: hypothetical protein ACR2QE_06055, partial [Acidimicrobiales bacterium]
TGWAIDTVGNISTNDQFTFTVGEAPPPECTAVLDGNGGVILTWDPVPGEDTYIVRRDNSFITSVTTLTYTDTNVPAGDHSYVIRSRMAGVTTDVACTPDPITV